MQYGAFWRFDLAPENSGWTDQKMRFRRRIGDRKREHLERLNRQEYESYGYGHTHSFLHTLTK